MPYYVWTEDDEDDGWARIDQPPADIKQNKWKLNEGESAKDWFPPEVEFQLSKDYGVKLADSIPNTIWLYIVSEHLKNAIEAQIKPEDVEFFPVQIRNQKKRTVDKSYYLMNVLRTVPCFDKAKSKYRMDSIIKDQVDRVTYLVLDESKIPGDAKLFRLAEKLNLVVVREDFAGAILDAGCNGIFFQYLDDFGKEFRD